MEINKRKASDTSQFEPQTQKKINLNPKTLTPKQQWVCEQIKSFLETPQEQDPMFVLQGAGGVGKTTLIKFALQGKNVLYLTPTHKAKKVLIKSVGAQNALFETIAAGLGLKFEPKTKTMKFFRDDFKSSMSPLNQENPKIDVVVVDECSLVADSQFQALMSINNKLEPKYRFKLIAMGDKNQLPPIEQDNISFCFDQICATLTEPMRNKGQLYEFSRKIANLNESFQLDPQIQIPSLLPNSKEITFDYQQNSGIIVLSRAQFLECFYKDLEQNRFGTRAVTYNNENSQKTSSVGDLRNQFFQYRPQTRSDCQFQPGDLIHCVSTVMSQGIQNADEFLIKNIGPPKLKKYTFYCRKLNFTFEFEFEIQDYTGIDEENNERVFQIPTIDGLHLWDKQIEQMRKQQQFKIFVQLQKLFPLFVWGQALTAHRSQGSTYRNVYLCLDNIQTAVKVDQRLKLYYVGVTRASDKLVILFDSARDKKIADINFLNQNSHLNT